MRLQRSRSDSRMFGLCGGIAHSTGVSSGWVRFAFILGCLFTGGTLFCLYILACMVVPKEPAADAYWYAPTPSAYAFGGSAAYHCPTEPTFPTAASSAQVDSMMKRLEEQAMHREIEELRSKLARYEQQ